MALNFNGNTPKKVNVDIKNFGIKHVAKVVLNSLVVWLEKVLTLLTGYPITLTNSTGDDLVDYKIYGNSVQDGEPTPDVPIEIKSVGDKTKNLVDISEIKLNKFISSGGVGAGYTVNGKNGCIVLVIECKPNTQYTLSSKTLLRRRITQINNGILVKDEVTAYGGTMPYTFTTSDTTNGIAITLQVGNNPTEAITQEFVESEYIQIEEGTVATDYEPYGYKIPVKVNDNVTNIYLNEPLRKIGDYADYIDFVNKKVVRNVKYRSFTGNETISIPGSAIKGYTPFRYLDLNATARQPFLCNYLTFSNKEYSQSSTECIAKYATNGQIFFVISNDRIPLNDTTAFKNWLKELYLSDNPLKVYYRLAEPDDTETVELPTISTNEGTNIIEVDTSIQPSNMEVQYYAKGV